MSYLETGKGRLNWLPAQAQTELHAQTGCVQCGSGLDAATNITGKCFNCAIELSEDDDGFDDLED